MENHIQNGCFFGIPPFQETHKYHVRNSRHPSETLPLKSWMGCSGIPSPYFCEDLPPVSDYDLAKELALLDYTRCGGAFWFTNLADPFGSDQSLVKIWEGWCCPYKVLPYYILHYHNIIYISCEHGRWSYCSCALFCMQCSPLVVT